MTFDIFRRSVSLVAVVFDALQVFSLQETFRVFSTTLVCGVKM